jgi:hypothetical protein
MSLHHALSKTPGLTVRFIDPEPGVRPRPDYQLTFQDSQIKAELKAIFSDDVRTQGKGVRFIGTLNEETAEKAWNKLTQPYRSKQLDSTQPSAVFVDISYCDELFLFLGLPAAQPKSNLQDHACKLLQQLAAMRRSDSQPNTYFFTCGFDPASFGLFCIDPVP